MNSKETKTSPAKYLLLYVPFLLSIAVGDPISSYLIAWAGSFFIFYVSFTNKIKPTSPELPLAEKIFKPLFLTQIIFAGYMSCTSIFYFLDQMGYKNFSKVYGLTPSLDELKYTAACQQYYLLGHAAFAHGLLALYKSEVVSKYRPKITNWPKFFMLAAIVCAPIGFVLSRTGALSVIGNSISGLALVAATISLALAIPLKQRGILVLSGILYISQLLQALKSGFKEPVIVSVMMLGLFLYPFYKRAVILTFIPLMLLLFTVLPTYVNTFRKQLSTGDADEAKQEALKQVQESFSGDQLAETNWDFLTGRISEIGMFTKYKESTDTRGTYYGFQIVGQAGIALIPRVLWPSKPITEDVAMVRVLENGIVSDDVMVSAKPQYIVDGYLSGGLAGIWIALFFYGAMAQFFDNMCEKLFGGYFFGTAFVCTGIFGFLWRGNCFEFIFNNMLYGFLTLFLLFIAFKQLKIIERKPV
ncbi:MAG: hypothetical protein EOO01_01740 [Chitinophagaceae bacterium]|nr:MAG: hypothetical protein EOO01_01740 [Chitinophagaceae bacterium]